MNPLIYDGPHYIKRIVVVGVGGTGSEVVKKVARILYERRQQHQTIPEVLLIDPDVVEAKNCGRQMFLEAQIGCGKAEVLAERFNFGLGLAMAWSQEPFDRHQHVQSGDILIDCVDNYLARREIMACEGCIISAGNSYQSGQVVIGNTSQREKVLEALRKPSKDGKLSYLPNAGLLLPALLQPEPPQPEPDATLSCAERVQHGTQHLMINDQMAGIIGNYLYNLLNRIPIRHFISYYHAEAMSLNSLPISSDEILPYLEEA